MNVSEIIKQKSYEKVLHILHRHPLTFIPTIILFIVLLSIPVIVYFLVDNLFPSLLENFPFYPLAVVMASIYYLSTYLFFYMWFIDFYLDMWIVTNDRIIDIEQHSLFSRTITELDLFRIQDVTTNVQGVFSTIFRYGDVSIKTASSTSTVVFRDIPDPNFIREQLIKLADEDRRCHQGQEM